MHEKLIRSLHNIRPEHQGGVLTIGNFDGVHLGHQQLLAATVSQASARGVPSLVMTFEPHAFEFFSAGKPTIPRLTRLREKFCALIEAGIDYVIILPFNHNLAELPASDFVKQLHETLHPVHIIVGDDFQFGRKRQGNFSLLREMGEQLGFSVEAMATVSLDGERISSTRVRQALAAGNHELARRLLGHPYTMLGTIRHGDKLGRHLGFPTANLCLHRKLTPVHGVYTVLMHGLGETPLRGVANVGERPTVDGKQTLLEVHLLDFDEDIYGRHVKVEFCEKLRDEVRYPTLDQLKEQIAKDVVSARNYFNNHGVL